MARILGAALSLVLIAVVPAGAAAAQRQPADGSGPVAGAPLPAPPGRTTLVSQTRKAGFPDAQSEQPSMSADGRFIAYSSAASNIVGQDPPGARSVYVLDRRTGRTDLAPVPEGADPGGSSIEPSISNDGRWVAFTYQASNFDGGFNQLMALWDRQRKSSELILVDSEWISGHEPAISADGRYIAFTTPQDLVGDKDGGAEDVIRWDRRSTETELVSAGADDHPIAGEANTPSISGNGNLVAFASNGGDTVVHQNTGSGFQIYVRDIDRGRTELISGGPDGQPPRDEASYPAISANGRYVAFTSAASNITPQGAGGLFRRDRQTDQTIMVSVTTANLPANGANGLASITADGGMVAWASTASNLVPETAGGFRPAATTRGAIEIYIRDIAAGETVLISVNRDNRPGGGRSLEPSIAGGGRFVAFSSASLDLVAGDDNQAADVFLRDLPPVPVVNPGSLDFGVATVDGDSLPLATTVGNAGWSPLTVEGARTTGGDAADFRVVADGCRGRVLRRAQACSVSVLFHPRAGGTRTSTLAVSDSFQGSPRTVRLRGEGARIPEPKLALSPEIGQPGIVTIVSGRGFPAKAEVRLRWSLGITPKMPRVFADGQGRFEVPMLVFHNDRTGPRDLIAEPAVVGAFPRATVEMLVAKPSVVPPRFGSLRIIDVPLVLVIRG